MHTSIGILSRTGTGLVLCGMLLAGPGCQETREPTTTLTQAQWEEVKAEILTAPPAKIAHPSGARFGDKIEFLGLDVDAASLKAGAEVTLTWYWKALAPMDVNWQVFVHFDHKGPPPTRQGMDHHPVRDLYQTSRWETGQIVRDVQKVRLRGDYPDGEAVFWVGLWDPATGKRLSLTNADKIANDGDNRIKVAAVKVKGVKGARKPAQKRPKVYAARQLEGAIAVDGKLDDAAWATASKSPLGNTRGGPGPGGQTWAKVLYDADNLYIGLHAEDKDAWGTLKERDSQTWTQEVVEIFIDPDGDEKDYIELQVTPNNVVFDARFAAKLGQGKGSRDEQINAAKAWNSNMKTAVHVDGTVNNPADKDKAWSVELAIPFADLPGAAPKAGDAWRINFYRFDAPRDSAGKPGRQIAWAWSPPSGSFHNVKNFGTLRFVATGGAAPKKPADKPADKAAPADKPEKGAVTPDKPE